MKELFCEQRQGRGRLWSLLPRFRLTLLEAENFFLFANSHFARKSAREKHEDIGPIHARYTAIVAGFRYVDETRPGEKHSLSEVFCSNYATDEALKQFLLELSKRIAKYGASALRGEQDEHGEHDKRWTLYGYVLGKDLRKALAEEWVRDHHGLMKFLQAVFKHWREILKPGSLWRVRAITQQVAQRLGYDRKRILKHLQGTGDVPNNLTVKQQDSWLKKIGQYVSRDQRNAMGKNYGFGRRPKQSIDLNRDTLQLAKDAAMRQGISVSQFVEQCVKQCVKKG